MLQRFAKPVIQNACVHLKRKKSSICLPEENATFGVYQNNYFIYEREINKIYHLNDAYTEALSGT